MMSKKKRVLSMLVAAFMAAGLVGCAGPVSTAPGTSVQVATQRADVLAAMNKANHYWQQQVPATEWAFWNVAAYHTGNMAAYEVTQDRAQLAYTEQWAEHNGWSGARSSDKSRWKYSYGETDEYVMFGDWQICFQVYADLYKLNPDPKKIARAREVMEYQMSTLNRDYWWWADGLYMVMPVMTKLYTITGDRRYLDKLAQYFAYANEIMYDSAAQLYYRDARYVYPKHQSLHGKKDFWARGDGWVFAGLARVLQDLPKNDPYRPEFERKFVQMAQALKPLQQADGYWARSLLDAEHAPGPEASGTAFFTYAYLWGINNHVLSQEEYLPTAQRGWKFLREVALQPDGKIAYVQPIGDRAVAGQVVDKQSTAHFGVGAFLLAGAEMAKFLHP